MRITSQPTYLPKMRPSTDNASQGLVFVASILVFGLVGVALFFSTRSDFFPASALAQFDQPTNARLIVKPPLIVASTPTIVEPTAVPVILAAGLHQVPTSTPPPATATSTPQPVATVASPDAASLSPDLGSLPIGHVGNTNGVGVFLRRSPHMADREIAWPDKTPMVLLGNDAYGDGQHWLQVRDPRANVGWIPAQYIIQ